MALHYSLLLLIPSFPTIDVQWISDILYKKSILDSFLYSLVFWITFQFLNIILLIFTSLLCVILSLGGFLILQIKVYMRHLFSLMNSVEYCWIYYLQYYHRISCLDLCEDEGNKTYSKMYECLCMISYSQGQWILKTFLNSLGIMQLTKL